MPFHKLRKEGESFYITHPKQFEPIYNFPQEVINKVFEFAYGMTFGRTGEHRNHRTGGQFSRRNGELFINTFQGKLAEFGLYSILHDAGFSLDEPDLSMWELGVWDTTDLILNGWKLNVKSTAFFGNLLLLETHDWNDEGRYIPNLGTGNDFYDFFILLRLSPDGKKIMSSNRWLYIDEIDRNLLLNTILQNTWKLDCPGFINHAELVEIITGRYILPQNSFLNGKTKMDAENYYVQAGDMHRINELFPILRNPKH